MAKLRSNLPVDDLISRHAAGESIRSLARAYGVTVATVSRHVKRAGGDVRSKSESIILGNRERPRGVGSRGGLASPMKGRPESPSTYAYVERLRREKARIVFEYKADRGCNRCPESHQAALDLHHVDPVTKHPRLKRKNSSGSRRTGGYAWRDLSFADLHAELAKCEVLCSNCHRKHEWEARQETS